MLYGKSLFDELRSEAHVWLACPEGCQYSADLDKHLNMLSSHERERFHSFKSRADKNMYLSAHVLLRTTLSKYVDISPENWMFERGKFGRPEIVSCLNRTGLRFNLSHTDGLAACVITKNCDCGVDVEVVRHIEGMNSIANNYFSKSEADRLSGYPSTEKLGEFIDIWTLKEAYAKAKGVGLSFPSKSISFSLNQEGKVHASFEGPLEEENSSWQFGLYDAGIHHKIAVALRNSLSSWKKIVFKGGN